MAYFEACVSSELMQNEDIWNFHGSLTPNKGKLIRYSGSLWYAIVSNMTHFDHNALVIFIIGESIVPAEYPAGESPASRIFG